MFEWHPDAAELDATLLGFAVAKRTGVTRRTLRDAQHDGCAEALRTLLAHS